MLEHAENIRQMPEKEAVLSTLRYKHQSDTSVENTFAVLIPKFIDYIRYELLLSHETISKYRDCLVWLLRDLPHLQAPGELTLEDVTILKKKMLGRGAQACRVNNVIFALRKFLSFCNEVRGIGAIDPRQVKPMKVPRRQVEFLTHEEIHQLLGGINTNDIRGLRMRALMELLLATGMRISEALSLNRADIDWQNKEATIIGKGDKQRTVYLTERAANWLNLYLSRRTDNEPPIFVTFGKLKRLARYDLSKQFRSYALRAGLKKKITPHILRHTMATLLLRNGCDIRYIQELLGHSEIQTTAQYYLGTDKRATPLGRCLITGGKTMLGTGPVSSST